jgi:hypothetical protein
MNPMIYLWILAGLTCASLISLAWMAFQSIDAEVARYQRKKKKKKKHAHA